MTAEYFDELMVNRQLLLWAGAVRTQLERWEPLVAEHVRSGLLKSGEIFDVADVWRAQTEHHMLLVAARNLLRAIDLAPGRLQVDEHMRAELIEGRDLHEHWKENLPIFRITPREKEPKYRSGQDFAAKYPHRDPYRWLSWSSDKGALVMPNVPARDLHELVDRVEKLVLASDSSLQAFVRPRGESPWLDEHGEVWPRLAGQGVAPPPEVG